jgi:hypothetical protein
MGERGIILTNGLARLVIPVLSKEQLKYESNSEGTAVFFIRREPEFLLHWRVVDYPKPGMFSIEGRNLVSFSQADPTPSALAAQLNRNCAGKFYPDPQGRVDYCLECLYTDETTPGAFAHALRLAFRTVRNKYAVWMRARWAEQPPQSPTSPAERGTSQTGTLQSSLFERLKPRQTWLKQILG